MRDSSTAVVRDTGATPVTEADANVSEMPPEQAAGPKGCDLSGAWLMSERTALANYGTHQVILTYYYVEIGEQGTRFTKSVSCGGSLTGLPPFGVSMDDSAAWPAYMMHKSYEGREVTSQTSASGCDLTLGKGVVVKGATVDAYQDLNVPLPTVDQPAANGQPGWEDWDNDGIPGFNYRVSGVLTGVVSICSRNWSQATGSIASGATSFMLPLVWGQTRSLLKMEGSPLLAVAGDVDPDPAQNFVQFAWLNADQASGDDATRCERLRKLAPMLTPDVK